ncbi:hypothetical protein GMMP13_390020 [Candidatus Magnetomoraceae bacterium gMMP-13]
MKNPFTKYPIVEPDQLIGRKNLLNELNDCLKHGSVLLFGGQRSGRTSVMKCLMFMNKNNSNEEWLYWDAHSFAANGGLHKLMEKYNIKSFEDKILKSKRLVLLIDDFDQTHSFSKYDFENIRALLNRYGTQFVILLKYLE